MINNIHILVVGSYHFGVLIPGTISKNQDMSQEQIVIAKRKWRKLFKKENKHCIENITHFLKHSAKTQKRIVYCRLLKLVRQKGWNLLNGR